MPSPEQIQNAISSATSFDALCLRIVDTTRAKAGQAISTEGSRIHGGRYNPKGEFGALYLSCDEAACLAELSYYTSRAGIELADLLPGVKTKVEISVKLTKVLDLTNPEVQKLLGVNEAELKAEWEELQAEGREAITQSIGRLAREAGFEALLVPSARISSGINLVVLDVNHLLPGSAVSEISQTILHFDT
jgi:RES domain-containing protein